MLPRKTVFFKIEPYDPKERKKFGIELPMKPEGASTVEITQLEAERMTPPSQGGETFTYEQFLKIHRFLVSPEGKVLVKAIANGKDTLELKQVEKEIEIPQRTTT